MEDDRLVSSYPTIISSFYRNCSIGGLGEMGSDIPAREVVSLWEINGTFGLRFYLQRGDNSHPFWFV